MAEPQEIGQACVVEASARDDRYFYAGLGCQVAGKGDRDPTIRPNAALRRAQSVAAAPWRKGYACGRVV